MKSIISFLVLALTSGTAFAANPPPNAPAEIKWNESKGRLRIEYHGTEILDAAVITEGKAGNRIDTSVKMVQQTTGDEKVEQVLKFSLTTPKEGAQLFLTGTVTGSDEAFPAETQSEAQKRFPYVRNCAGLSRNLRNNAVYDRRWDWVLEGPGDGGTRINPTKRKKNKCEFSWESKGPSLTLVFRPRFYQKHKGLKYYEPWTYRIWKGSLTGYCTWWSYRGGFTQEVLDGILEVFAEKNLPDFGYSYMQLDNCYQQGNGSCPENWLNWNSHKYPDGWTGAMKSIKDAGMQPGIWVHRIHRPSDPHVSDIGKAHPDWFVKKADGTLFRGNGFYVLNTANKEAVNNMVRKLYKGLKEQGWDYVKIDGTGDLLRAYQHRDCAEFFKNNPTSPELSLRRWDEAAREELGPDVYILACHTVGNARNVIGLVDGARLSNDGFQPLTLAQYSYLEGVAWRNDPDHCDVLGGWLMDMDAMMPVFALKEPVPARSIVRPAICAMAGGVLMVSDKMEVYTDDRNIEGMKRSAPVLSTVPGQLYGCGRYPAQWWLQEIELPFDHWNVLARIQWGEKEKTKHVYHFKGLPSEEIMFADLGLSADREYVVFEFWSQKYLGRFKNSFTAPEMDVNNGMQVFSIREAREHPWVISTTRHLSQGAISLENVKWDGKKTLSGKSRVVIGDPYVMTVHIPEGFRMENAEVDGKKAEINRQKETAAVRCIPAETKTIEWKMIFRN